MGRQSHAKAARREGRRLRQLFATFVHTPAEDRAALLDTIPIPDAERLAGMLAPLTLHLEPPPCPPEPPDSEPSET